MTREVFRCPADGKKCDHFDQIACGIFCRYIRPGDDSSNDAEVIVL
jgi:hypothetical protein